MPCNTHRKSTHFPVPLNVALDAQVKRASNCYSCEIKFPARTGLSERERGEGGLLKINTFPFLFNFSRNLSTWQRTLTKLDYRWKMCVRVCDGRGENPFFFCEPHSARVFPLENPLTRRADILGVLRKNSLHFSTLPVACRRFTPSLHCL